MIRNHSTISTELYWDEKHNFSYSSENISSYIELLENSAYELCKNSSNFCMNIIFKPSYCFQKQFKTLIQRNKLLYHWNVYIIIPNPFKTFPVSWSNSSIASNIVSSWTRTRNSIHSTNVRNNSCDMNNFYDLRFIHNTCRMLWNTLKNADEIQVFIETIRQCLEEVNLGSRRPLTREHKR